MLPFALERGLLPIEDGATSAPKSEASMRKMATTDGNVSVSVRQQMPLRATLRATRKREHDVVYAA